MNSDDTNPFLNPLDHHGSFTDLAARRFSDMNIAASTPRNPPPTVVQPTQPPPPPPVVQPAQPIYLIPQQQQLYQPMKLQFSGLASEDANNFMTEFESHMVLMNIEVASKKYEAAFRLQLKGPALVWYNALDTSSLQSWESLKQAFLAEYKFSASALIAEEAAFSSMSLKDGQRIEEFHAMIQEKGKRLTKSERDMIHRFTDGLPKQLAFFVRASRVTTFRECLHVAKTGEAHGYRATDGPFQVAAASQPRKPERQHEISGQQTRPARVCFKCQGKNHIKPKCKWTGIGQSDPNTQCQLCSQFGHGAKACCNNPNNSTVPEAGIKCQICAAPTHTAKNCNQLNSSGLGAERTSQT